MKPISATDEVRMNATKDVVYRKITEAISPVMLGDDLLSKVGVGVALESALVHVVQAIYGCDRTKAYEHAINLLSARSTL